jgi:ribosomal protein L11 methyltransferase
MQEGRSFRDRTLRADSGWVETTIEFVDAREEAIDSFVAECIELGAVGSMEATVAPETAAGADNPDNPHNPCETCETATHVQLYFPESLGIQGVVDLLGSRTRTLKGAPPSPDARARIIRCRRIEKEDWATSWKGSFPPERVSGRFWVVPPWQATVLPEDAVPIILEPGLAFGTGKHQTTRHCLEFLEEIAAREESFPRSCLDVGCGSGILSIAARRLGATRVVGLDTDSDALGVACRNLRLNRLSGQILLVKGSPACCRARFDLITANLDATTLLRVREGLWSLLTEGGLAVLSGVLDHERDGIARVLQKLGFQPLEEKKDLEEGWTSSLLRKPWRP